MEIGELYVFSLLVFGNRTAVFFSVLTVYIIFEILHLDENHDIGY